MVALPSILLIVFTKMNSSLQHMSLFLTGPEIVESIAICIRGNIIAFGVVDLSRRPKRIPFSVGMNGALRKIHLAKAIWFKALWSELT